MNGDAPVVAVEHVNVASAMRAAVRGLRERGIAVTVLPHPDALAAAFASLEHTRVLLVGTASRLGRAELERLPALRGVVFIASGTNSIDMGAAAERGIVVAHAPISENTESMAEATIMLMLAAAYDLERSQRLLRAGWERPAALYARMLRGKTIGLIGFGAIARAVADRLAAWHVDLAYTARRVVPDARARYLALDELVAESDIVSVHVPLSAATANLIDRERLGRFKPGAILVNTSRGGIVDEAALADALHDGRLGGAAIDTFVHEPIEASNPLLSAPRTILTPHIVGHSVEANEGIIATAIDNVVSVLEGRRPRYVREATADSGIG